MSRGVDEGDLQAVRVRRHVEQMGERVRWYLGVVERLHVVLGEVVEEIEGVREVLRWSQPFGEGKLGVRWWYRDGGSGVWLVRPCEPVLVRWVRGRGGHFFARELRRPPRVYKDYGSWGLNVVEVRRLVGIFWELRREWLELVGVLMGLTNRQGIRRLEGLVGRGRRLGEVREIGGVVRGRLELAGYVVDMGDVGGGGDGGVDLFGDG